MSQQVTQERVVNPPTLSEAGQPTEAVLPEVPIVERPIKRTLRELNAAYLGEALHATRMAQEPFLPEDRKRLGNLGLQIVTDLQPRGQENVRRMIGKWLYDTSFIPLDSCREAVEQVDQETEDAERAIAELEQMRAEIGAVVARLDPKARAIVGVVQSLSWLEGCTNSLGWAQEEVNVEGLGNWKVTEECLLRTAKNDPDIATMAKVFDLVRRVRLAMDYESLGRDLDVDEDPAKVISRIRGAEAAVAISEAISEAVSAVLDERELRAEQS